MSVDRARRALCGAPTDCPPILDMPVHPGFVKKLTGIDPFEHTTDAVVAAIRALDIDLVFHVVGQVGAPVDDGTQYGIYQTAWKHGQLNTTDILAYDPVRDRPWDLPAKTPEDALADCQGLLDRDRALAGDTALPMGINWQTCIHYAAEDLDWETFFMECVGNEEEIDLLLDRFQAASTRTLQAHAHTDLEVMFTHDDIAAANALLLSPAWMRRHLIPRYRAIFQPIKDKGIPLLFASDGNILEIAPDLLAAGADGLFVDNPCVDFEALVERCGTEVIYLYGPSPALMETGSVHDVRAEMRRIAEYARHLPRFFFNMPGTWTHTMPTENVQAFYEGAREYAMR